MSEDSRIETVSDFYDMHPISEQQIVEKLKRDGLDLSAVTENELQDYDQDHFGGTAANVALAELAKIDKDCEVLDVCSGMGGPSRYLAQNYGCRVVGIDLTESRVSGARRLTDIAGLSKRVTFECANALDMPFTDERFDVLISQEAFCHIPDKVRLVAQCVRVLKPGGCIAFTDIVATENLGGEARVRLQEEMTFQELSTVANYRHELERNGCEIQQVQNVSDEWRDILVHRLAMYRSLKEQTVERFGEEHFRKWDAAYSFFVGLHQARELGGSRFCATRKSASD